MKIKLSRSQWEEMGKKAGWIKKAQQWQKSEEEIQEVVNKALQSNNPLVLSQLTNGWPPILIQEVQRRVQEQRNKNPYFSQGNSPYHEI